MILRAEMDAVNGSIFDFLYYFAGVVSEQGLKPWGRVGRERLAAAINLLTRECDYEHWIACEKCHREFAPFHDERVLDAFLAYYRQELDWGALCRCTACGGVVCERIEGG